jgi:hypothetical protein
MTDCGLTAFGVPLQKDKIVTKKKTILTEKFAAAQHWCMANDTRKKITQDTASIFEREFTGLLFASRHICAPAPLILSPSRPW